MVGVIAAFFFVLVLAFAAVRSELLSKTSFGKLLAAGLEKIPLLSNLLPPRGK